MLGQPERIHKHTPLCKSISPSQKTQNHKSGDPTVETKKVFRRNEMFELTIELLSPRDFLPAVETDYLLSDD